MKKKLWLLFCLGVLPSFAAFAADGELKIGGKAGWNSIPVRDGIAGLDGIRPYPVLSLSSSGNKRESRPDLDLSFDDRLFNGAPDGQGNYELIPGENIRYASGSLARYGGGAALFYDVPYTGSGAGAGAGKTGTFTRIIPRKSAALFSDNHNINNFSIEFTIFPNNMSSGEEIFLWQADKWQGGKTDGRQSAALQFLGCSADKNRLVWKFENFFVSPDGQTSLPVRISSRTALTPKTWSSHLLRFNGGTGLLEYFINGRPEAVLYVNPAGREGGEVFTAVTGSNGFFILGRDYSGILDEFKISGELAEETDDNRFRRSKGRIESAPLDTGSADSELKKIGASGGNLKFSGLSIKNDYDRSGSFHFPDNSQLQLFVRASRSAYTLDKEEWIPVENKAELFSVKGRYIQVAADFYPGEDFDSAPYLEEICLQYKSRGLPLPPENFRVQSGDGFAVLSWKERKSEAPAGYLVYYGVKKGEYFGEEALPGPSPVDVGKVSSVRLDNLKNGTLYYFTVAAYNDSARIEPGPSSRELSVRPLRTFE